MEGMEYFYELYCLLPRGGPGDNASTRKAFCHLKDLPADPLILDIGCGHGVQTIELARLSKGRIIALDAYQPFLDILRNNAAQEGYETSIIPKHQSMHEMKFPDASFDIIWSEGALYFLGFQNGLRRCHQLLKPNGYLAVTESVLLLPDLPEPLQEFWNEVYPDIKDIKENISIIQNEGLTLLAHFTLPKTAWTDNYYRPMKTGIDTLRKKYPNNTAATQIFEMFEKEIKMYQDYSDYYGYEFFIMRK
jgi:ubiquinone/menaquinone biosynthesis C-methylase UbiE